MISSHEPYGVAAGTHLPSPAIAAVFAKDCSLAYAWQQSARRRDPRDCRKASVAAGVQVLTPADPSVPPQLSADPVCPAVLFVRGNLGVLDARRVGIVGTRNATQAGRACDGSSFRVRTRRGWRGRAVWFGARHRCGGSPGRAVVPDGNPGSSRGVMP